MSLFVWFVLNYYRYFNLVCELKKPRFPSSRFLWFVILRQLYVLALILFDQTSVYMNGPRQLAVFSGAKPNSVSVSNETPIISANCPAKKTNHGKPQLSECCWILLSLAEICPQVRSHISGKMAVSHSWSSLHYNEDIFHDPSYSLPLFNQNDRKKTDNLS